MIDCLHRDSTLDPGERRNWSGKLLVFCVLSVCWSLGALGCRTGQPGESEKVTPKKTADEVNKQAVYFQDITDPSGLDFKHQIGSRHKYFLPDIIAGGCGAIDFNRDGKLDLVLVNSGSTDTNNSKAADNRSYGHRIYQQTEPGQFRDVTLELGLTTPAYGCGLAIADVNNDGFDDLFVSCFGNDALFLNEKGKRFRDVTSESGIKNLSWGTSATFFDYDLDGKLDLFVTNYVSYLPETNCGNAGDAEDFCSPQVFASTVDRLFHNESEGSQIRFRDVTAETGIASKKGPGLGVIARDFNRDGYPDLYVANDGKANFLWINRNGKTFEEQANQLGCAMSLKGEAQAGMGIAEGDIDLNGVSDIVVTHLDGETNAAYLGSLMETEQGQHLFFTESGGAKGVQKISNPMTGFGVALPDLDNDGDQDMLTVNGRVNRRQREPGDEFLADYAERNQISLNQGSGDYREFQSPDPFNFEVAVSRGLAIIDLDDDGQLDCLVTNAGNRARLFRNCFQGSGNWIGFRVCIPEWGGRTAIGAKVTIRTGSGDVRFSTIQSDGSYLSAADPRAHFGLGEETKIDSVEITWADGTKELFSVEQVNRYHDINKGTGKSVE